VSRRRKQDIALSLRGIVAVIAALLAFIVFLMVFVILERLVLG
jgi:hypothetical protein